MAGSRYFRFTDMLGDSLGYANDRRSRSDGTFGQASTFKVVADAETMKAPGSDQQALDQYLRQRATK